jgi:uncharacterized protein (TIGR02679 family)
VTGLDQERLRRLLGHPQLAWLVRRVRCRMEEGRPLEGTVTLAQATAGERQAVHRLLGRPPRRGRSLNVSLEAVDELLRRSGACAEGLAVAVVRLGGPVTMRKDASDAWREAFTELEAAVGASGPPELVDWLDELRRSGLVKRLQPDPQRARRLLGRVAAVVSALPADGEPLGQFAARHAGSAHALDHGKPLATLALGAARVVAGLPPPRDGESPAESRREAWAAVGLLRGELSSVVLSLGIPGGGTSAAGRLLAVARDHGEPVALTLRQLVRNPPSWDRSLRGTRAWICENPVVLALAADRLGPRCPPLVCTSGQPGAAVMTLLRGLVAAGAHLVHHGDFDWGGIRIGNVLHARLPVAPWRFDSGAYERAVAVQPGPRLGGAPIGAAWDAELSAAMQCAGRAVEEETVVDELLDDLAMGGGQAIR